MKLTVWFIVLLFSVCTRAAPCHFKAAVSLTPPYTGAHCPNIGAIVWAVGYSPITKELYVLPKLGESWSVSARTYEEFSACSSNHCFILHTTQRIVGKHSVALGVEFWGTE